jgi:SPP1 family predicted phage head-tail adaptor
MQPGHMDQKITLQRLVRTADGVGGTIDSWQNYPTNPCVWAKVTAKAGRENMTDGRMVASYVVLFEIWNRQDINERDRIVWQNVTYNIRGIRQQGGRRPKLVIEAERGVAS